VALTQAVLGLRVLDSFQCLTCSAGLTKSLQTIQLHVSKARQQKPAFHKKSPLWRACKLQTFFAENRFVNYFVVEETAPGGGEGHEGSDVDEGLDPGQQDFFKSLDSRRLIRRPGRKL
jgi:hypothetical protein